MILLDANLLLRLLLKDDATQYTAVLKFLHDAFRSKRQLKILELTFAEVVWILEGRGWERKPIMEDLTSVCLDERIDIRDREVVESALRIYSERGVSFIDAFQAAYVAVRGLDAVASFDRDFDKLGIKRIEPRS